MSDTTYLALGCLAFLVTFVVQHLGWRRLLRPDLRSGDPAGRRRALRRWGVFAGLLEVCLLVLVGLYAILMKGVHPAGFGWAAPPLGALLGSSLPLQTAALAIGRAGL